MTDSLPDQRDVIVVGSGLAGHAAALSAAEDGASVLLLEKGADFGGASRKAGGGFLFADTELQAAAGMDDDIESLRELLQSESKWLADESVVDAYVANQLETYQWLVKQGSEFRLLAKAVPGEISRIHDTMPGSVVEALHARVVEHPAITFVVSAAAKRLLRADDGRVDGVLADVGGIPRELHAGRGVVLASGGFSQSKELLAVFAPQWVDAMKMGGAENTGDGLTMAWQLGAGLADMAYVQASFGASIPHYPDLAVGPGDAVRLLYPNLQGAMIVNLDGRRFVNEDLSYKLISGVCAAQPRGVAVQVFDQKVMDRSSDLPGPWHYTGALHDGLVRRSDSIAGLADALGLPAEELEQTVAHYNGLVDARTDGDFGRTIESYGIEGGGRIDSRPYYGFPCTSGVTTTYCGVTVAPDMTVLDVFGAPIPGLFGAGELVGGFHGAGYAGGSALGKAAVFGRIAGRSGARA